MARGNWKNGLSANGRHPLMGVWSNMKNRCENYKAWQYKYYGGKGVRVCERWKEFANFVADMGERPLGTTLDRIDGSGDYSPDNCRWATPEQQMNNHGINRWITVDGERLTLSQAARKYGLELQTVWARINVYGWSEQDAATRPLRHRQPRINERAQRI
jgi:hypothetical protein